MKCPHCLVTIHDDIITIVSFKLPTPDISIIESDTTAKLIELANMLEKGLLSKEEFEKMKKDLIK